MIYTGWTAQLEIQFVPSNRPNGVGFSLSHGERDKPSLRNTLIFEAFSVVKKKVGKITPCSSADRHQSFGEICCLFLQDKFFYPSEESTLQMETCLPVLQNITRQRTTIYIVTIGIALNFIKTLSRFHCQSYKHTFQYKKPEEDKFAVHL